MTSIITQKQLRAVRNPRFCYLCGEPLKVSQRNSDDHVPPSAVFLAEDRNPPLILRSHENCNHAESANDEVTGGLVNLLHGHSPPAGARTAPVGYFKSTLLGDSYIGLRVDLRGIIWRWIRGFHAALYQEFLPADTKKAIHPPMQGADDTGDELCFDGRHQQQREFVADIKRSRKLGTLDRVVSRNEKCRYECVWTLGYEGAWTCCFGLRIYDWERLGETQHFPRRGCVGLYMPRHGKPPNASEVSSLIVPFRNFDPFDPFEE